MDDQKGTTGSTPGPGDENASSLSPHLKGRELWRSIEDLAQTDEFKAFADREFQEGAQNLEGDDRRQFMKVMGASFALAGLGVAACRRLPETTIAPYAKRPADRMPGVPVEYATSFELAGAGIPILAKSFDGRPINVQGNANHPHTPSGACGSMTQGTVLGLYDPDRIRELKRNGEASDWNAFSKWLDERCNADPTGAGIAILSGATSGPSMDRMQQRVKARFPGATWTQWEAINDDNEFTATMATFGVPMGVRSDLSKAEVVVSLDADFLGTAVDSLSSSHQWAERRRLSGSAAHATMSRVYQFEAMLTVSGIAADERVPVRSGDIPALAGVLLARLGGGNINTGDLENRLKASANRSFTDSHGHHVDLSDMDVVEQAARDLDEHRGRCVVLAGAGQPPAVHAAAAILNERLGNVGKTVSYASIEPRPTRVKALDALKRTLKSGSVKTLVIFECNPVYDAPADFDFASALGSAQEVVYVGTHSNETSTSGAVNWVVPGTHYLEAWGDTRARNGMISMVQPLIYPLVDQSQGGRSALEIVARMTGEEKSDGLSIVRETATSRHGTDPYAFERRWRASLARGYEEKTVVAGQTPKANETAALSLLKTAIRQSSGPGDIELVIYHDSKVYDGRFANIGWMQELPDPVSKLTWDNALYMGPELAKSNGVKTGDIVHVGVKRGAIDAAVMVVPGWTPGSCAISIGYGRGPEAGRVADAAGFDAYPIRTSDTMNLHRKVSLKPKGESYPLAHTQDHGVSGALDSKVIEDGIQERLPSIAREGSLEMYREDPGFGGDLAHITHSLSLWEEGNLDGAKFRWAMSVDLSTCTGCSACVTACQSENNIPIVGKDQVLRGREMHWIRIDRYFKGGTAARPEQIITQPVTCQQCENAPCEQVCPVAATLHDKDGLNVMVYNRCIGTRYCSNNCPYKVRRFNWFDFQRRKPVREQEGIFAVSPDYYTSKGPNEWRRMQFNPDVTVRSRGVMEKCSFCTQRITAARIKYKNEWTRSGGGATSPNWSIPDGSIKTACQEACPTGAIIFGDLNDAKSQVSKLHADKRSYDLLGELNTKPRLKYLTRISNPSAHRSVFIKGGHGGGHNSGHGAAKEVPS